MSERGEERKQESALEATLAAALNKRRSQATIRQLTTQPANAVDFSSNDFLSLASSRELRQAFVHELTHDPALTNLGSGGSRLLDGNSVYAENLERELAAFHRAPAGLLCNSGLDANVGLFSCLPQPGDIIVYDELIHASVHDGMRLSRCSTRLAFAHNDVASLQAVLEQCKRDSEPVRQGRGNVFIAVEAVYSMDGDLAPLTAMVQTIASALPAHNGHLIVDEAHSNGIYGAQGRGLVCELGLEDAVTVRLYTFGKALACNGAILCCRSPLLREYLLNYARPLIYTTFMSYPALAAIKTSYRFLQQGKTEHLVRNLRALIAALHEKLLELRRSLLQDLMTTTTIPGAEDLLLLRVPERCPQSAISWVRTSQPKALAAYCQRRGFVVRGIVAPTVPPGTERIRICLHAGNTVQQVEALVGVIRSWVEEKMAELREGALRERARL